MMGTSRSMDPRASFISWYLLRLSRSVACSAASQRVGQISDLAQQVWLWLQACVMAWLIPDSYPCSWRYCWTKSRVSSSGSDEVNGMRGADAKIQLVAAARAAGLLVLPPGLMLMDTVLEPSSGNSDVMRITSQPASSFLAGTVHPARPFFPAAQGFESGLNLISQHLNPPHQPLLQLLVSQGCTCRAHSADSPLPRTQNVDRP